MSDFKPAHVEELRSLLAKITVEDDNLKRGRSDLLHAELTISEAMRRREEALEQIRELLAAAGDYACDANLLEILTTLSQAAEHYGRSHP